MSPSSKRSTTKQLMTSILIVAVCAACERAGREKSEDNVKRIRANDGKISVDKAGDACGFEEAVSFRTATNGDVMIPPSHPRIRYIGRIDCADGAALRMSHVGAQIQVRFEGERIEMLLEDFGNERYPNFYNVIVDDKPPVKLEVSPKKSRYPLAEKLGVGVHTVTIFKRTESCAAGNRNNGKAVFKGFVASGDAKLHPPPPMRRPVVEFIGDSITCGYGNEVSTETPEHFSYSTENSNGYLAYGAVATRMLGGTYLPVAYSGRGLVRNWAGAPEKTLPEMYLDILPDDEKTGVWDVNRIVPDIVVINLGTNDFSIGVPSEELDTLTRRFEREYEIFLDTLRRYYPDALIVLAVGPLLADAHPPEYNALSRVKGVLAGLVRKRMRQGDGQIHLLEHAHQRPPYGEDWHPTSERHRIMAEELVSFISSVER